MPLRGNEHSPQTWEEARRLLARKIMTTLSMRDMLPMKKYRPYLALLLKRDIAHAKANRLLGLFVGRLW